VGDFNFIRSTENRNRPGADMNDIFIFNEIISYLGLLELPLKGRNFTCSNMQDQPLLQQIDWFFTSNCSISNNPNTLVTLFAKFTSDHTPCVVNISTVIPKAHVFCFENHWVQKPGFMDLVKRVWDSPVKSKSSANILTAKFKNLRYELKKVGKKPFSNKASY
jgi:hypothetical protein